MPLSLWSGLGRGRIFRNFSFILRNFRLSENAPVPVSSWGHAEPFSNTAEERAYSGGGLGVRANFSRRG